MATVMGVREVYASRLRTLRFLRRSLTVQAVISVAAAVWSAWQGYWWLWAGNTLAVAGAVYALTINRRSTLAIRELGRDL